MCFGIKHGLNSGPQRKDERNLCTVGDTRAGNLRTSRGQDLIKKPKNHFFSLLGSKAQLLTWHANYTASELPKGTNSPSWSMHSGGTPQVWVSNPSWANFCLWVNKPPHCGRRKAWLSRALARVRGFLSRKKPGCFLLMKNCGIHPLWSSFFIILP